MRVEASRHLRDRLKSQAAANVIDIVHDESVKIRCQSESYPEATFLVFWPHGTNRIHMLVPKRFVRAGPKHRAPLPAGP
jgi:hypothetical protein